MQTNKELAGWLEKMAVHLPFGRIDQDECEARLLLIAKKLRCFDSAARRIVRERGDDELLDLLTLPEPPAALQPPEPQ